MGDGYVDAYAAAAFLTATGTPTTPEQIRQWAVRGKVRRGPMRGRWRLYSLDDVRRIAATAPVKE